jgi:hypothetical protein
VPQYLIIIISLRINRFRFTEAQISHQLARKIPTFRYIYDSNCNGRILSTSYIVALTLTFGLSCSFPTGLRLDFGPFHHPTINSASQSYQHNSHHSKHPFSSNPLILHKSLSLKKRTLPTPPSSPNRISPSSVTSSPKLRLWYHGRL